MKIEPKITFGQAVSIWTSIGIGVITLICLTEGEFIIRLTYLNSFFLFHGTLLLTIIFSFYKLGDEGE